MYGTQTTVSISVFNGAFENDVEMYGTQTYINRVTVSIRLRMM